MRKLIPAALLALILPLSTYAQNSPTDSTSVSVVQKHLPGADSVSAKSLRFVDKKYTGITNGVDSQTVKMLQRMQRKESKLQKKLQGIDSTKAQQLFANSAAQYQQLQSKLQAPFNSATANKIKQYLPGIDSMGTVMRFLSGNGGNATGSLAQIQNIGSQVQQLQGRLQQANEAQAFIQQREQELKDQLGQYSSLSGQLLGMNKEAYYYQQQLQQYKDLANDPEKLGEAILSKVSQLPAFQSFWQRNSMFSQLFPVQQSYGTPAALAGLQTRAQIQSIVAQRLPGAFTPPLPDGSGGGTSGYLQQQLEGAQSQLGALKDKLGQLGGGGSSDMTMPDFTPNSQHNKSFLKRITVGYNLQTEAATAQLPAISDIGLAAGYKLSDKATVGGGLSYKLGLGNGINHISFSSQGMGLRSYLDIKAKGNIWVTGGFEYDYLQAFAKFSDLKNNIDAWQKSALLGITKKFKAGSKEGNMQLLYDFLAARQVPQAQPVKFRVGWAL